MTLFGNTFLSFCPIFVASLPFLLLRPNSCGPVTFGLQALVELHMRLQENSEYKLSRALNTTCYSVFTESWTCRQAFAYFNILRKESEGGIPESKSYTLQKYRHWVWEYWGHFSNRAQIISRKKRRNLKLAEPPIIFSLIYDPTENWGGRSRRPTPVLNSRHLVYVLSA